MLSIFQFFAAISIFSFCIWKNDTSIAHAKQKNLRCREFSFIQLCISKTFLRIEIQLRTTNSLVSVHSCSIPTHHPRISYGPETTIDQQRSRILKTHKSRLFPSGDCPAKTKVGQKYYSYQSIDISVVFGCWVFFWKFKGTSSFKFQKIVFSSLRQKNVAYPFSWGSRWK